jgi:hypothetical protein
MKDDGDEEALNRIEKDLLKLQTPHIKKDNWAELPPLHLWNPPLSGTMDLRITKNGDWVYNGNPIRREAIVKLFSRILKREGDDYYLVTPVEKWQIEVEDTPWIITNMEVFSDSTGEQIVKVFTNVDETIELGKEHPLRFESLDDQRIPYALIRNNLWARVNRPTFYDMVRLAEEADDGKMTISSHGLLFHFGALMIKIRE